MMLLERDLASYQISIFLRFMLYNLDHSPPATFTSNKMYK